MIKNVLIILSLMFLFASCSDESEVNGVVLNEDNVGVSSYQEESNCENSPNLLTTNSSIVELHRLVFVDNYLKEALFDPSYQYDKSQTYCSVISIANGNFSTEEEFSDAVLTEIEDQNLQQFLFEFYDLANSVFQDLDLQSYTESAILSQDISDALCFLNAQDEYLDLRDGCQNACQRQKEICERGVTGGAVDNLAGTIATTGFVAMAGGGPAAFVTLAGGLIGTTAGWASGTYRCSREFNRCMKACGGSSNDEWGPLETGCP